MKKLVFGIFFLLSTIAFAQDNPPSQHGVDVHHIALEPNNDSLSLQNSVLHSHWQAHVRTFYMSTINEGELKDDYALGAGAGIGVLTKPLFGFQVGISGFFIYNLVSSDINQPDKLTGGTNRYEIGLFDIQNPENKNDLDRLEELYVKYSLSKSAITFGKINITTPFLNPQDGRMRPTLEEGIWLNINESKKIGFNGGWIWEISPRSTIKWFQISNSIGINPSGLNSSGKKSNYYNNLTSSGMAIANVYYRPNENIKINLWNGYLDNIMNSALVEINTTQKLKNQSTLYEGLLFMHQDAIHDGGNQDQTKTYIDKGAQSNIISAQLGIKNKRSNSSINYTHITGDGRYLMPREWGRDPFYTFLPRERSEGMGNVHAMTIKTQLNFFDNSLSAGFGYGLFLMPDVKNYRLNKYGMPSYQHINLDAAYNFKGFLNGMVVRLLVAAKVNQGETYDDLKYIYNKVNMVNFNLIVDFKI